MNTEDKNFYPTNAIKRKKDCDIILGNKLLDLILENKIEEAKQFIKNKRISLLTSFQLKSESTEDSILNFLYYTEQLDILTELIEMDNYSENINKDKLKQILSDILKQDDMNILSLIFTKYYNNDVKEYASLILDYITSTYQQKNLSPKDIRDLLNQIPLNISYEECVKYNKNLIIFILTNQNVPNLKEDIIINSNNYNSSIKKDENINKYKQLYNGLYFVVQKNIELKNIIFKEKLENNLYEHKNAKSVKIKV